MHQIATRRVANIINRARKRRTRRAILFGIVFVARKRMEVKRMRKIWDKIIDWLLGGNLDRLVEAMAGGDEGECL